MRRSGPTSPPRPSSSTWQPRQLYLAATSRPARMGSAGRGVAGVHGGGAGRQGAAGRSLVGAGRRRWAADGVGAGWQRGGAGGGAGGWVRGGKVRWGGGGGGEVLGVRTVRGGDGTAREG